MSRSILLAVFSLTSLGAFADVPPASRVVFQSNLDADHAEIMPAHRALLAKFADGILSIDTRGRTLVLVSRTLCRPGALCVTAPLVFRMTAKQKLESGVVVYRGFSTREVFTLPDQRGPLEIVVNDLSALADASPTTIELTTASNRGTAMPPVTSKMAGSRLRPLFF